MTIQTGLRVSEVIGLNCADINTSTPGAHVRCTGKERSVPLTREAAAIVTVWLRERRGRLIELFGLDLLHAGVDTTVIAL